MSTEQSHPKEVADVLARAATDSAFRASLLEDADSALRHAGVVLPSNTRLQFVERPQNVDALIVLPDLRSASELSIEELEAVAGGTTPECPMDSSSPGACKTTSCTPNCAPPE